MNSPTVTDNSAETLSIPNKVRKGRAGANKYPTNFGYLTRRQEEVVDKLLEGLPHKAIATDLSIHIKTLGKHVKNIHDLTGVNSNHKLLRYAILYWNYKVTHV